MKGLIIIPFLFSCLGQYPKLRISEFGGVYNANSYEYTQIDSTRYYYIRFVFYKNKMNEELEKINRLQNPQITRKVFMFQDSCIKYKTLLDELKK